MMRPGIAFLAALVLPGSISALPLQERPGEKGSKALLPIPDGLVVLCFDDGNKSDIRTAAPILERHGFRATFFITEGLGAVRDKEHFLTWKEVRELHEKGFEIGNHTRSHPDMARLPKDRIRQELRHIQKRCVEHSIPAPVSFCYPGWQHALQVVEVLKEEGFKFARRGVGPEFPDGGRGAGTDGRPGWRPRFGR